MCGASWIRLWLARLPTPPIEMAGWYVRFHLDDEVKVKATEICMDKALPAGDTCGFQCSKKHTYPDCPLGRYEDMTMIMAARANLESIKKEGE